MNVPFLDLKAQHAPLRAELLSAIGEVIDTCAFAGGPFVAKFETEFAAFAGAAHAVAVGNGTDALWVALLAKGIGAGDEVITVPNTFIATAEAISYTGATPVFVDIDEKTYTMDPARIERAITSRTKAIIPVHLYGQMADMDPIMEIARKHKLLVIEDACQAHGASYKGRPAGTIGDAGCFSFYPGKNLGAIGEGGATVTNDAAFAARMKVFRDHGQEKKYFHSDIGWNCRMDGIQAVALSIKLKRLAAGNEARRQHAANYTRLLNGTPNVVLPSVASYGEHVFHLYVIRVPDRDAVLESLAKSGINCAIHYPRPIHLQKAYAQLGLKAGSFPISEGTATELLSLPMYPELRREQIEHVAKELKDLMARTQAKVA